MKEANSDRYDSAYEDEASHFRMADNNFGKSEFRFAQFDKEF